MSSPVISIVINYFNPQDNPRVRSMVLFGMECLTAFTESPFEIILVDGSGVPSPAVFDRCRERGWSYLTCSDRGAFARIYNQGMQAARGQYGVWMASDIFVCSGWDKKLIAETERTRAWMAAPYLTNSDYMAQTRNYPVKMRTFVPSAMTFNLNLVTRQCLDAVGYMDDRFTGNFNDIDYLLRIRQAGGEAIVVDAGQVLHAARATSSVASTFRYDDDLRRFVEKYPELARPRGVFGFDIAHPLLCRRRLYRGLVRLCHVAPKRLAFRLYQQLARLEPLLSSI